jgi:xanthine dehydrogenase small subunit
MSEVTNTVRFVLDGRVVEVKGERRTTTVLDYLREDLRRTGTKEGCAEGDCGACVVMVGELNAAQNGVDYVTVNSCLQLLPTLDGKSIKTVESLKFNGQMHPIQEAMKECHGSQCGFCTPGIVMSLVNMTQTNSQPTRLDITDALSGNLCRCTGYKPIIDATHRACEHPASLRLDDQADVALLKEIRRADQPTLSLEGDLIVQPVVRTKKGNEFVSPSSVDEVAEYLIKHPNATLLAGSSEIGLQVNKEFHRPDHILYLGHVKELKGIQTTPSLWKVGAMVSLEDVMHLVKEELPDFAEVLRRFGSPPIRFTATLAGNIANGSPIGDSMPCLMALGTTLILRQGSKTRRVDLDAFYTGLKKNIMHASEFIQAIEIPRPQVGQIFVAHKVSKRFEQDISATCAAMTFVIKNECLSQVRLAFNGLSPSPARAFAIEKVLEGKRIQDIQATEIDQAIAKSYTARDGLRATWAYRSLVARNLVLKFINTQLSEVTAS